MRHDVTFASARAQLRIQRLLAALESGPLASATLAEKLHCDQSLVTEYLEPLMASPRKVRIAGYEVVNGCKRPMYGLGSGPDEPNTVQTNVEKWARVKADPVRYEASLMSRRESARRVRAASRPEGWKPDRRVYTPPLPQQVEELVKAMPGYTTVQIAAKLNASESAVIRTVTKLRKAGAIRRAVHGHSKAYQWESPANPLPVPLAFTMKPQGPFAALGL